MPCLNANWLRVLKIMLKKMKMKDDTISTPAYPVKCRMTIDGVWASSAVLTAHHFKHAIVGRFVVPINRKVCWSYELKNQSKLPDPVHIDNKHIRRIAEGYSKVGSVCPECSTITPHNTISIRHFTSTCNRNESIKLCNCLYV
jgi:hypothetical protein